MCNKHANSYEYKKPNVDRRPEAADQAAAILTGVFIIFLIGLLLTVGCTTTRKPLSADYYYRLYSDMCFYVTPEPVAEEDKAQVAYYAARCNESKEMERSQSPEGATSGGTTR